VAGQARRGRRGGAFALAVLVVLGLGVGSAAAQDGPYGSTSTTAGPGTEASCQLRTRAAAPGETVSVRLKAIPRGERVEIRLDGETVAEATATSSGSSPRVNLDVDFVVPADTEPGEHIVTAVSAGFNASCQTANGDNLEVASGAVLSGGEERGGGSLARTGMYAAILVVTALGLLLVGRAVLTESRRRARSASIDQPRRRPGVPRV
jgi:hypothetical protein